MLKFEGIFARYFQQKKTFDIQFETDYQIMKKLIKLGPQ